MLSSDKKFFQEKICDVMRRHPESRDCDTYLIFHYWADHAKDSKVKAFFRKLVYELSDQEIRHLRQPETIIRMRRHIQNDLGLFKPVEQETVERRERAQQVWHTDQRLW